MRQETAIKIIEVVLEFIELIIIIASGGLFLWLIQPLSVFGYQLSYFEWVGLFYSIIILRSSKNKLTNN